MHFGENQLSPLSIGISPLATRHPSGLQSTPVRASTPCYGRFTLRMASSSGFGSTRRDHRPLQTCFRSGSSCHCLNLPRRVTRRIILQKARRQADFRPSPPTARKHTVSGSVSLPSPGFFSPFPHGTVRYRSLRVFSLGQWAAQLQTRLLVSGPTQDHHSVSSTCPEPGFHGLWRRVPNALRYMATLQWITAVIPVTSSNPLVATPAGLARPRFGLSPVRSPLLRGYSLFLGVREMFQFPRCPPTSVGNRRSGWVAPFGNRGIIGHTRLPHAYRSGVTSFIGTQRRGILHVLIVSSLQVALQMYGVRQPAPPVGACGLASAYTSVCVSSQNELVRYQRSP